MKQQGKYLSIFTRMFVTASICLQILDISAQCNQNFIYGLTNVGMIQRINVSNGSVAAPINPAFSGNAPNLSNAMGYNPLNGKYYFFKRNTTTAPQEFVSFDPATNLYASLASSPVGAGNIVNLGCVNASGLGYYCLDAFGALYYYDVALDSWTTICTNVKDQFGTTLSSIIGAGSLNRYYGDLAFDGAGNLWALISGPVDYGLYKITGPLPISTVANLTAVQLIAPNTPSPGGTFGGIAFSASGAIYLSSNSPNNKLYELSNVHTLSFVTNLGLDGIGNDLTSCNFPLTVLASARITLSASLVNNSTVVLNWNVSQSTNSTGYEVEGSADGIAWEGIHFSFKRPDDLSTTYTFSESKLSGGTRYYRIQETDQSGKISYSTIEKVNAVSQASISIWPNPAQDIVRVQTAAIGSATSRAFIYDLSGRMISSSGLKNGVGNIAVQALQPGTYIVQVTLSDGKNMNQKFVKQ
jgi:hypothetical protein